MTAAAARAIAEAARRAGEGLGILMVGLLIDRGSKGFGGGYRRRQ
jgi:hypothetical protein